MAQRFYSLVLLPRVRDDIAEHKRLHFALYQAGWCKLNPVLMTAPGFKSVLETKIH